MVVSLSTFHEVKQRLNQTTRTATSSHTLVSPKVFFAVVNLACYCKDDM